MAGYLAKKLKIHVVSKYDQEIPQLQIADKPMAPRGRATQQPWDTRKTNQAKQSALSSPSRWLQNQNRHKATHNKKKKQPQTPTTRATT